MVYFTNSRRVIEEINLLLRWYHLFLLVIFRTHCEVHGYLYSSKYTLQNSTCRYTTTKK